jgi:ABC-type lipoprotein release transport system permease subunit
MVLAFWLLGIKHGGFVQMVDQAVRNGLGHYQVLADGYLDNPEPRFVVHDGAAVVATLRGLDHVVGVSARAVSEGMASRDNESAQVKVIGVDPAAERLVSVVPSKLFQGDVAVSWCRRELAEAQAVMGGSQELFDRWCDAMSSSEFLPEDNDRALVLGAGLAKSLLVSIGDEVTLQVVRAVTDDDMERGEVSTRRLEVTGLVRVGNPEVDDMVAYVHQETLMGMLGTAGPNEVVVLLDDIGQLDAATAQAREALAGREGAAVYTWSQRNPSLASLIEMGASANDGVYFILFALIALGVFNAVYMSVLERTKEFGVMLSLGMRRARLFSLVMTEVGLLGMVSVGVGSALGLAMEIFGRVHGWPMEWFGYEEIEGTQVAGVTYETIYYSALSLDRGIAIVLTMFVMFLLTGLLPAIRASRLAPVEAMRVK